MTCDDIFYNKFKRADAVHLLWKYSNIFFFSYQYSAAIKYDDNYIIYNFKYISYNNNNLYNDLTISQIKELQTNYRS